MSLELEDMPQFQDLLADNKTLKAALEAREATAIQIRADERERCASEADCYPYRTPLEIAEAIRELE